MQYTIIDDFDDEDSIDSSEKRKEVEYYGRKFVLTCKDPFGHWYARPEKGTLPLALDQVFTNLPAAGLACKKYAGTHPIEMTYHQKVEAEGDTLDPNRTSIFDRASDKRTKANRVNKVKSNAKASGN